MGRRKSGTIKGKEKVPQYRVLPEPEWFEGLPTLERLDKDPRATRKERRILRLEYPIIANLWSDREIIDWEEEVFIYDEITYTNEEVILALDKAIGKVETPTEELKKQAKGEIVVIPNAREKDQYYDFLLDSYNSKEEDANAEVFLWILQRIKYASYDREALVRVETLESRDVPKGFQLFTMYALSTTHIPPEILIHSVISCNCLRRKLGLPEFGELQDLSEYFDQTLGEAFLPARLSFVECEKYELEGIPCYKSLLWRLQRVSLAEEKWMDSVSLQNKYIRSRDLKEFLNSRRIPHRLHDRTRLISEYGGRRKECINITMANDHIYVTKRRISHIYPKERVSYNKLRIMKERCANYVNIETQLSIIVDQIEYYYPGYDYLTKIDKLYRIRRPSTAITDHFHRECGLRPIIYTEREDEGIGIEIKTCYDCNKAYPKIMLKHKLPIGGLKCYYVDRISEEPTDFILVDPKKDLPIPVVMLLFRDSNQMWMLRDVYDKACDLLGYSIGNPVMSFICPETVEIKREDVFPTDEEVLDNYEFSLSAPLVGKPSEGAEKLMYAQLRMYSGYIEGVYKRKTMIYTKVGRNEILLRKLKAPNMITTDLYHKKNNGRITKLAIYSYMALRLLEISATIGLDYIPAYMYTDSVGYKEEFELSSEIVKKLDIKYEPKTERKFPVNLRPCMFSKMLDIRELNSFEEVHDQYGCNSLVLGPPGTGKSYEFKFGPHRHNYYYTVATTELAKYHECKCVQTLLSMSTTEAKREIDDKILVVDECFLLTMSDLFNASQLGPVVYVGDINQLSLDPAIRPYHIPVKYAYIHSFQDAIGTRFIDNTIPDLLNLILTDIIYGKKYPSPKLQKAIEKSCTAIYTNDMRTIGYRHKIVDTITNGGTIHSEQGKTIKNDYLAIVDWKSTTPRLIYTAISRCKSTKYIALPHFSQLAI